MDPISIAASASSIAALCGAIITVVGRFAVGIRSADRALEEFRTNISALQGVLTQVEFLIKKFKQLPFAQRQELKHLQDIKNVLKACHSCLYRLKDELPDPGETSTALQKARKQWGLKIKSTVFIEIRAHLTSYTQILNLSLTTMSLGSMWEAQNSLEMVRGQMQKLTTEIRKSTWIQQLRRSEAEHEPQDDFSLEQSAVEVIRAWRESAEKLAVAVTLYGPDQQSTAEEHSPWNTLNLTAEESNYDALSERFKNHDNAENFGTDVSQADSGIGVSEEILDNTSDWDPEPEEKHIISAEILRHQIAANQSAVSSFLNSGLYTKAEEYQRRGIKLQDGLSSSHNVPFHDKMDAEETLADILTIQVRKKDGLSRAKDIFQRLLQQEIQRKPGPAGSSRRWRLYHKLADIYLRFGHSNPEFIAKSKEFATRALEGRKNQDPIPIKLVVETTQLLIKACQLNQEFDEAEGFRHWLHEVTSPNNSDAAPRPPDPSQELQQRRIEDPLLDSAMVDVLNWCKSTGFNVDSSSFRFEDLNRDGKTPLHVAVKEGNLLIVEHIAEHVKTLETPDRERGATALWVAAETKNRRTTKALLHKGANVAVTDRWGNTPLHAVQSATGGIAVAKLLLDFSNTNTNTSQSCRRAEFSPSAPAPIGLGISVAPPSIAIDAKNSYEKTALHIACEMGNGAMVQFLLERGADLSSRGPAGCTPLHSAVYARRIGIVKLLLSRGADTAIRDNRGYNASKAAKRAEMQSQDIIRMIQEVDSSGNSMSLQRSSYTSNINREVGSLNSLERRSNMSIGTGELGTTRREISTTLIDNEDIGRNSISEVSNVSSLVHRSRFRD